MKSEQSLLPSLISLRGDRAVDNVLTVAMGVLVLSLLAQLSVPLPWTPVPITGQTFGVALISMMWGRKRGFAAMLIYLGIGALGFPVFAMGKSGFSLGPTTGYLLGMLSASYWMGTLSDRGWTKTFFRAYLVAMSGSLLTFSCGLLWLSSFVAKENLLMAGLFPFLPGDFMKTTLASAIVFGLQKSLKEEK